MLQVRRDRDRHVRPGQRAGATAAPAGPGEQDYVEVLHVQRRRRVRVRRQRAPALALHLGEIDRHTGEDPTRHQRFASYNLSFNWQAYPPTREYLDFSVLLVFCS